MMHGQKNIKKASKLLTALKLFFFGATYNMMYRGSVLERCQCI